MNCAKCGAKIISTSGICFKCTSPDTYPASTTPQKTNKIGKLEHDIEMLENRIRQIEELLVL